MLIFYAQVSNPDKEMEKKFLKLKLGMGKILKKMQKEKQKEGREKIVIQGGDRFIAAHSFAN